MPFDANGNFSLVPGTIVADGMNILPSQHNPPFQDVANGLSQAVVRDGRAPMTGPLNMNGYKITGVAAGDAPDDVVTNAAIADLGVAIGDGKWSLRDLSPNWLRRDGTLYTRSEYPELSAILPPLPDGVLWESLDVGGTTLGECIVQSPSRLTAIYVTGASGASRGDTIVVASIDGGPWNVRATITDINAQALAYGANIYVMLDGFGYYSVSQGGDEWSPSALVADADTWFTSAAYGNGLFVAVGMKLGQPSPIYTSDDGVTWTSRSAGGTTEQLWGVDYVNDLFIITGNNGVILTSQDGINWTTRTSGTSANLRSAAYSEGVYCVVGAGGAILTSTNLSSWTARASGIATHLESVVGNSLGFLAVGDKGIARISGNGTTWAAAPTGITSKLTYVISDADSDAQYYAVGNTKDALYGLRTFPTQFRVPNDDPDYGWIRAL